MFALARLLSGGRRYEGGVELGLEFVGEQRWGTVDGAVEGATDVVFRIHLGELRGFAEGVEEGCDLGSTLRF